MKTDFFITILLLLLSFKQESYADDTSGQAKVHAMAIDSSTDLSSLKNNGVIIDLNNQNSKKSFFSPNQENELLAKANLEKQVKDWDQLEKDRLFILLMSPRKDVIKKYYSSIDRVKLLYLKRLIKLEKAK